MAVDDLKQLKTGLRLLFWTTLVGVLAPNVWGFLLPFLGHERIDLRWGMFTYTIVAIPALYAVFLLTGRHFQDERGGRWQNVLRLACRVLASLELLRCAQRTASYFIDGNPATWAETYRLWLAGTAAVVAVLIHLRWVAGCLGVVRLRRSFLSLVCAYGFVLAADGLIPEFMLEPSGGLAIPITTMTVTLLYTVVWIWGLILLARFRKAIDSILAGYCGNCGYNLTGNVSGICPECGTAVES